MLQTKNANQHFLCNYKDKAVGAKPVPLHISSLENKFSVNSNYFAGPGVDIILTTNSNENLSAICLGDQLRLSLTDLQQGVDFSPAGLFCAHSIEIDQKFNEAIGGIIRFGYLKSIFSLSTLTAICKNLFHSKAKRSVNRASYWESLYGTNWGIYELSITKSPEGQWKLSSNDKETVNELVAVFKVNKAGIATGIETMESHFIDALMPIL